MTRSRTPPRVLERALRSTGGRCYRHCERPIRVVRLRSSLPGTWRVRVCPSGVVSLAIYAEVGAGDPLPGARRTLGRWARPASLVKVRDLRTATRHGPELGRAAERYLSTRPPSEALRMVYWRVYSRRSADGRVWRLFLCRRKKHAGPVFFRGDDRATEWPCPECRRRSVPSGTRRR